MKTFKQLKEEWYQTYHLNSLRKGVNSDFIYGKGDIKIYKNPTMRELGTAAKLGQGAYRAFLMDNGSMYAWGDSAHIWVADKLFNDKFPANQIPIQGDIAKWTTVKVSTTVNKTKYKRASIGELTDTIKNHRHLRKLFKEIVVKGGTWG